MLIAISCLVLSLICFCSSLWKWRKPRNPNAYRQLTAQVISSGVQNIETKEKNVYEQYGIYHPFLVCRKELSKGAKLYYAEGQP